ncbi:MAG TPA: hypothetical protein VEK34_06675 [Methylocella sp.]|nr:hypothetical protein [Methylocella sp.]
MTGHHSQSLTCLIGGPLVVTFLVVGQASAQDVRHECSQKYQEAKAAGTLGSDTWPQFYSKCAAEARANAAAAPAATGQATPLDSRKACSEKYQAARAAGTLGGETWPQFYSRCTAELKANPPAAAEAPAAAPPPAPVVAAPAPAAPPPPPVAEAPPPPAAPAPVNPLKKTPPAAAPQPSTTAAAPSSAIFPTAISPTFAGEKPAKARMKTCAEQYKTNKATNANGGLKWIQKGGGYWSECNKRLKGEG